METKITKRNYFEMVIALAQKEGRNDLVQFAQHEIELLDNKKANKTATATQKANLEIKDKIVEVLGTLGKAVTITELLSADKDLNELVSGSQNKLTALVTQLKNENKVIRTVDKKKAYFSIA